MGYSVKSGLNRLESLIWATLNSTAILLFSLLEFVNLPLSIKCIRKIGPDVCSDVDPDPVGSAFIGSVDPVQGYKSRV